ncbi:aminoglycoside phosphotransferase [Trinickia caryophylli]|nr:aminoglycoside phosphotransferase [Trinickia caryophylli]
MDLAMRRAASYPHPAGAVKRIETHISVVYLAGRYAYKIAKPVNLGFVDFTTARERCRCAFAALRLNRRLAPAIYLDVVPIRRIGRTFTMRRARGASIVDHALKMRRFDERDVFSNLLASGRLLASDVEHAATSIASFHRRASRHVPAHSLGSAQRVVTDIETVLHSLVREAPTLVDHDLRHWCREETARLRPHFAQRRAAGFVRECHGDLHLENIVRLPGGVAAFDCIEFDEGLRWTDVTADIAFTVMDFLAYGHGEFATRFLNRWLGATGDFDGLAALRFYIVYRALVRALVARLKARDDTATGTRYLTLVRNVIAAPRPFLVLCHGYSGSGKSVAAQALAPLAGAIRISSDMERKREKGTLADVESTRLPAAAYTHQSIDSNYVRLSEIASRLLAAGLPVIVDASFLAREHRAHFISLAQRARVALLIADFNADTNVMASRLARRASDRSESSDAGAAVLMQQMAQADVLTHEERSLTIPFDTDVAREALEHRDYWSPLLDRLPHGSWLSGTPHRAQ